MTSLDRLAQSLFPDSTLLNVPDFARLVKHDSGHAVIVRYSDLDRLREHHRASPLPPCSLYLIMDGHIGEYPVPLTEFTAITPFGLFNCSVKERKQKASTEIVKDTNCTACMFGIWPCTEHIRAVDKKA